MKEKDYPLDSWQGYTTFLKESLGRLLTEKEYKKVMQSYINGVEVDACLKTLAGGK